MPVQAGSVPLAIIGFDDDDFWATNLILADAPSASVFADMGYRTIEALIELDAPASISAVDATISFGSGSLAISGTLQATSLPHDSGSVLITIDDDAVSALFGTESGDRYELGDVTVESSF